MPSIGGDTSSGAVPIPVSSSAMASTAASNSASATITSSNTPTGTTAASFNQQATFVEQQQQQRIHQHVYSVPIQAPGYPYYQQQQHQQGIAAASPHMQSFSPPSQTSLASSVQQHEQQRQQHHHHYQQQQQGSHAYAYAASSPVGSPASPLGYLGGASPPPSHLPMPQAHTMAGLGTGSGAGYAIVGGGQVMAGSPTQAYAYYPAPGPMGPSPGGSPQMAPLSGVGNSVGGAFMAHHIPIAQRQNGASSASGRDHNMATGAMAAGSPPPPPSVALSISPPPYLTHPLDHQQLLSPTSVDVVDSRNVYIRNLPEDCTDDVLIHMSSVYGEIESSKSIIHEETGKCKGYGFVKYKTMQQALAAIEAFNMQGFQSTLAKDSFKSKLKRLQDKSSANVYISNLSSDIDEEALVELIKPYPVVSARILRDALTGQHKGAGFARMPDRDTAMLVIEKLKGLRLPNSSGPLLPRIADSEGQKQLKKQINGEGGGRFDDAASPTFVRSETTSPLMWSPVLVYSPAGSPPPIHSFDSLGAAAMSSVIPPTDGSQQMSSLQTKDHAYQHHHQHQQSAANAGFYAIPTAATAHYGGFMSSGYVSPVGYASPHLGYAASPNSGYISPGYLSSGGYASSVQMSGSPQAYGQFPEQPQVPVSHPDEYDQGLAPAEETGGNKDVEKRNRSGSTSNRRRNNTGGSKQQMGGRGGRRKSRGESQQTMQKMPDHGSLRELSKEIQKKLAL
ncbi:hypothetical protein FB645_003262 [Coemansia sp. IMI 203386]|nr:hypothetical protein FB645_003262 [Coemansia sp. IMI 203386]